MDPAYTGRPRVYRFPKRWTRSYKHEPEMYESFQQKDYNKPISKKCGTIFVVVIFAIVIIAAIVLAVVFSMKAKDITTVNTATLEADFYLPDAEYVSEYAVPSSAEFQSFSNAFCDEIDITMSMEPGYLSCEVVSIRSGSLLVDVLLKFVEGSLMSFGSSETSAMIKEVLDGLRTNSKYGDVQGNGNWQLETLEEENRREATRKNIPPSETDTPTLETITANSVKTTPDIKVETFTSEDHQTSLKQTIIDKVEFTTIQTEIASQKQTSTHESEASMAQASTETDETSKTDTKILTTSMLSLFTTQTETVTEVQTTNSRQNTFGFETSTTESEITTQIETSTGRPVTTTRMETSTVESETTTQIDTSTAEPVTTPQMETSTGETDSSTQVQTSSTLEISTAPADSVEAIWNDWTNWGGCDVTCGSGFKQRARSCAQGSCVGSDVQSEVCTKAVCVRAALNYNVWSKWGAWSECGATCGNSTQRRERECGMNSQKLDCLGNVFQERGCNLGECPDCTLPCSGTWDTDCLVCECPGAFVSGRVTTMKGGPLDSVVITSATKTYVNLAITGNNGGFNLTDVCNGQEILFTRSGYQSKTVILSGETSLKLFMEKIVSLSIIKQSNNAGRLAGSCLELQCEAMGYPKPDNYEWFKDGIILANEVNFKLSIASVTVADSGFYRCRANNDYGAALSDEIEVVVKDNHQDFCQRIPTSRSKQLPDGCTYNGLTEIDTGRCAHGLCSKGGETTCTQSSKYECGVTNEDIVYANCSSHQLQIQIIKECGCIEKEEPYLEILGVVQDSTNGLPIPDITITTDQALTNTSETGEFLLPLLPGIKRITLDLTDPLNRYVQQIDNINFGQNSYGTLEHIVRMTPKSEPVIVSAAEEVLVELGTGNGSQTAFGDIIIPGNSMYDADGNVYEGNAQLTVEVYDPRDNPTGTDPPGDFSALGDDGNENRLISTGMMRMDATDMSGNSLQLGGEVEILLDESMIGNDSDIGSLKLWQLDPITGRWIYEADIEAQSSVRRRKRYIYTTRIRGIEIDSQWWNFDKVSDQICHTKIRVFQSNTFNTNEQLLKANVMVITLPSTSSSGTSLTRVRPHTDDYTNVNGFCIVHPCNSPRSRSTHDYHGYILADYKGTELIPGNDSFHSAMDFRIEGNKIHVNFDYYAGPDGPYYDWDYYWSSSLQCSNAPVTDLHFRFYKDDVSNCQIYEYTILQHILQPFPNPQNLYLWNTQGPTMQFSACYIKVVTSWDSITQIQALSLVGYAENSVLPKGDMFGVRQECTENRTVCVEVRPPFGLTDGITTYNGHTAVLLKLIDGNPMSYSVSETLLSTGDVTFNDDPSIVGILLKDLYGLYGSDYGVYCVESSQNFVQAQKKAENACRRGTDNSTGHGVSKPPMTEDGWAIKFHNFFVTAVPPTGRCPGGSNPRGACWSIADVNTPFEYCTDEKFICRTCSKSYAIPESPDIGGTCNNTDRVLEYGKCCPKIPLCPGGFKSYGACWNPFDGNVSMFNEPSKYCTEEGFICPTCWRSYSIPEFPNDDGTCNNTEFELEHYGCCPRVPLCPGGYLPYRTCWNPFDLSISLSDRQYYYCTNEGFLCPTCRKTYTIPEYPNENGTCNDLGHDLIREGCCPDIPKCPGGYYPYGVCNNTETLNWQQYCTDEGYICIVCISSDYNYFYYYDYNYNLDTDFDPVLPEYANSNGTCDKTDWVSTWRGCCPGCPGGEEAYMQCDPTIFVDTRHRYCTQNGHVCKLCTASHVVPERVNANGVCSNTGLEARWEGCCPPIPHCPHGYEAYTPCSLYNCSYEEDYCSEDNVCCTMCYVTKATPEPINEDRTCNNTDLVAEWSGCCPPIPLCPSGDKTKRVCQSSTDCGSEHCTETNACCPKCPTDIEAEYAYANGTCPNSTYTYLDDYGCCP